MQRIVVDKYGASVFAIFWGHFLSFYLGAKLIYLPPYSPDFNPIKQGFHSLKSWLRCHEAEVINSAVRPWLIHRAIQSVTAEDAVGFITNCGYE